MDEYFRQQFESEKTYIVAVSGGVDSVVLLDKISQVPNIKPIIAHFDHQIRGQASADDANLVRRLANKHHYPYRLLRGGLGQDASEEQARTARYQFLRCLAQEYQAQIVVAHHFDDVIETIAINLKRGTGWQGLAVMGASDIIRPMINLTKEQIIAYAKNRNLIWNEDSTNSSQKYLRNRLRQQLKVDLSLENRQIIFDYFWRQKALKRAIMVESNKFCRRNAKYDRYFWIMIDYSTAVDLLRNIIKLQFGVSITIPQAEQAIITIKAAQDNTTHQISQGICLEFSSQDFLIKLNQKYS